MHPNDQIADEYRKFQTAVVPASSNGNLKSGLAGVATNLKSDLVGSRPALVLLYLALSIVGYITTLAICAQNGVGLLEFSRHAENVMMTSIPHPWCALLCGALFGGIPFVVSFFLLNRFRRRYLLFRMWWLPLFVPVIFCFGFIVIGDVRALHDGISSFHSMWVASAVLTPYLLEGLSAVVLRQRFAAAVT